MKQVEVTAKDGKEGVAMTITVDFAETVEEAVEAYGEEALLSNAFANARVTIQNGIRRMLRAEKSHEEVQEAFADYKLGVAIARSGGGAVTTAQLLKKAEKMSEEDLAAFIEALQNKVKGDVE